MATQKSIVVNNPPPPKFESALEDSQQTGDDSNLVGFVVTRVNKWRDHRRDNYEAKWEEYYRLWRGIWNANDKVRNAERSRIIAPALQQAIEMQVAEFEEATFSRKRWFAIEDNAFDEDSKDVDAMSKLLMDDFETDKIKTSIAEVFLNGAIYGTGIGKVVVVKEKAVQGVEQEDGLIKGELSERLAVKLVAVDPFEFVIDPAAKSIESAMGCAHEMLVPRHTVLEKQDMGMYKNVAIGTYSQSTSPNFLRSGESFNYQVDGDVKITEYYGLVPKNFIDAENVQVVERDALSEALAMNQSEEGSSREIDTELLVESWITIANDSVILRAQTNPFLKKDRPFLAYQHDKVPNRFWGRGVAEKGYNVQKALDGELRARMDTLALSTYPMLAMDSGSIPRDGDFHVRPGRTLLTNGDPNSVIKEFKFSEPGPGSFRETAEMERMVQMATGSMDSAAPVGSSPRNATASGMSMISTGSLKRQKRTLQSIETEFLNPLLEKCAFRYMQYDPLRYKFGDYTFSMKAGLGLVARELEEQNLIQLLQTSPPGTPSYYMTLRNVWALSSTDSKEEMIALTDQMLKNSMEPKENPELKLKEAELKLKQEENLLDAQKFAWSRAMDVANYRNEGRKINQRSTEFAMDMQQTEAERPQFEAIALEKTASAVEKLAKASAVEGSASRAEIQKQMLALEERINNTATEGEAARMEATSEFMDLMNALQGRTEMLENKEPAIQEIVKQGTPGPQGPQGEIPPEVAEMIRNLQIQVQELKEREQSQPKAGNSERKRTKITRNAEGLIESVDGRKVKRNAQGLIEEV